MHYGLATLMTTGAKRILTGLALGPLLIIVPRTPRARAPACSSVVPQAWAAVAGTSKVMPRRVERPSFITMMGVGLDIACIYM